MIDVELELLGGAHRHFDDRPLDEERVCNAWTTPRTWVTSEVVTSSIMNTHVRDNLSFLNGAVTVVAGDNSGTSGTYADLCSITIPATGNYNIDCVGLSTIPATAVAGMTKLVVAGADIKLGRQSAGVCLLAWAIAASALTAADVVKLQFKSDGANTATHYGTLRVQQIS